MMPSWIYSKSIGKEEADNAGHQAEQALAFTHKFLSLLLADVVALQKEPPLLTLIRQCKEQSIAHTAKDY
jgi:hypothetical protein